MELPAPFKIFAIRSTDLLDVITYCIVDGNDFNGFNRLRELWVNPKHRSQGFGTIMILFLLKKLELKLLISKDELVLTESKSEYPMFADTACSAELLENVNL